MASISWVCCLHSRPSLCQFAASWDDKGQYCNGFDSSQRLRYSLIYVLQGHSITRLSNKIKPKPQIQCKSASIAYFASQFLNNICICLIKRALFAPSVSVLQSNNPMLLIEDNWFFTLRSLHSHFHSLFLMAKPVQLLLSSYFSLSKVYNYNCF